MTEGNKKLEYDIEERNFDFKRFLFRFIKYWYVFAISVILAFFILMILIQPIILQVITMAVVVDIRLRI